MAVLGCAHAAAKPPASAASSSSAPASSRASSASGGGSAAPLAPDRSEEITAAELASIPDPVPAASEAQAAADSATAATATAASGAPTTATTAPGEPQSPTPQNVAGMVAGTTGAAKIDPGAPGNASSGVLWRVQIFASPDLSQAGQVAREASAKLGEPAVVEYEGSLYKVRLGAFGSEAEAQSLRERAIAAGYPGAFRMRASGHAANDAK